MSWMALAALWQAASNLPVGPMRRTEPLTHADTSGLFP